ncbi:hypothetical protein ABZP36_024545 [Zizania latifolia]
MENNSSDVQMSHCAKDSENSESSIEIKIKTLDSQTYNLRVNKRVPVPLLKEKIATVTGILSEQQRLICRGRVLKDDELLSAYHVENGHTLHLVVRQPGQSVTPGNAGNEGTTSNSTSRRGPTMTHSIVLEAVNVGQGNELPNVTQLLQSLFRVPSSTLVPSGPAPSDTRPSEATQSSMQNGIRVVLDQLQVPPLLQSEAMLGVSEPNVISDSLTTMSQYINFLRDSFRREGFLENGQTQNNLDHRTAGSAHGGGTQNQESQPDSASAHGLPTAELLAETMHSTRQLIVEHAGALLSQLPNQLGDLVNVTDSTTRRNIQQNVVRYGVLVQYLGSLLLELGRTTMMLRINPATSEAVVNSGPALFISPSGPNPLMVPPAPYFPGTRSVQMDPIFSNFSSYPSALHQREVDIHVHTSGSVSLAGTDPGGPVEAHQTQEHIDRTGNASSANISEAFAGVTRNAPFAVESAVRLLPLRTVVAVPAGISRPRSTSSSGVGVIYPLLTRIQQRENNNGSDAQTGPSPNEHVHSANQQLNPQSSQSHETGNLGSPVDVNGGNSTQTSPEQQNGQGPFSQLLDSFHWIGSLFSGENSRANVTRQHSPMASAQASAEHVDSRNHGAPEVSGVSDEGLRFASLVRQIMPFISQVESQHQSAPAVSSSTSQAVPESLNHAREGPSDSRRSHQHNRDPVDAPNCKRQRTSE